MKFVTTPIGRRQVAGVSQPWLAFAIDLYSAMFIIVLPLAVLGRLNTPQVNGPLGIGMGLLVLGYALFAHRSMVPSIGYWALSLRRYHYEDISEYTGSGTLFIVENVETIAYVKRIAIIFLLFYGAYVLLKLLATNTAL